MTKTLNERIKESGSGEATPQDMQAHSMWAFFTPIGNEIKPLNTEKSITRYLKYLEDGSDSCDTYRKAFIGTSIQDNTVEEDRHDALINMDVLMDYDHHATANQY